MREITTIIVGGALALTVAAASAAELPPEYLGRWGVICRGLQRLDAIRDVAMKRYRSCQQDYRAGDEEIDDPLIVGEVYYGKTTVTHSSAQTDNSGIGAIIDVQKMADGYLITEIFRGEKSDYVLRLMRSSDGREFLRQERRGNNVDVYCRLEGPPRQLRCRAAKR